MGPAHSVSEFGGRPRSGRPPVLDAIIYLLRPGCQWRQLPNELPALAGRTWLRPRLAYVWCLGAAAPIALYPLARLAAGPKARSHGRHHGRPVGENS